jgi:Flp pilus assembly protein TadG
MLVKARAFLKEEAGVVAIIFAMSLPMIIGAAGIAVDLAQAYNIKTKLSNALDKAALAGGSTDGTDAEVTDRVTKFFNANYPPGELGTAYGLSVVVGTDQTVAVSAHAKVNTTFMGALGTPTIDVQASTTVKRELAGVEAVLVLDVTGSMDDALGSTTKIAALRKAVGSLSPTSTKALSSTSFLGIMFSRIQNLNYIKIGIVPFSDTVNVGPYGLGKDLNGNNYGTAFVDKPGTDAYVSPASNIVWDKPSNGSTTKWWGCITERVSPKDTNDDATPNWGMYRYPKVGGNTDANNACTQSIVVPLTNDKKVLANAVYGLVTGGNTYGDAGMVWGYHLISPTAPFTEGVDLADKHWSKTVIFMSDGDNNVNNTYSVHGASPGLTDADIDTKFKAVCTNLKNAGITVYTISFGTGLSTATKTMFQECASDAGKYYNSTTGTDLSAAFQAIANQLSSLHIVN